MTRTLSAAAERQLERRANRKLAVLRHVEEVSGSVAATCRYYGISRQAYDHWELYEVFSAAPNLVGNPRKLLEFQRNRVAS